MEDGPDRNAPGARVVDPQQPPNAEHAQDESKPFRLPQEARPFTLRNLLHYRNSSPTNPRPQLTTDHGQLTPLIKSTIYIQCPALSRLIPPCPGIPLSSGASCPLELQRRRIRSSNNQPTKIRQILSPAFPTRFSSVVKTARPPFPLEFGAWLFSGAWSLDAWSFFGVLGYFNPASRQRQPTPHTT